MTTKNCKNGKFWEYMECFSFNNTWKKENWPELQKKHTKHCNNATFFPGMTSVLQKISPDQSKTFLICWPPISMFPQAPVSFKKYRPPPLPYFKVNICPFPLPHFASIFFAYLWSFRWSNYIVTLPRYFSFRLPHLNIDTGPPSDELDKNIQRRSHFLFFSHWNGYSNFRSILNWFRN
jgi:hypothetical protein